MVIQYTHIIWPCTTAYLDIWVIGVIESKLSAASLFLAMFIELWFPQDCDACVVEAECNGSGVLESFFV